MAPAIRRPPSAFASYLRSAADLRLSIHRARSDAAFAGAGGRIVYVVDANVVRLFLDPTSEVRHLAMLGEDPNAAHLPATAMITAETLFSRGLPGQHGRPPILAPSHAEDVGDMMAAVHSHLERADHVVEAADVPPSASALARLARAVHRGKIPVDDAVRRLGHELPRVAKALFADPSHEARQFRRLFDDDLLRPMALLPGVTHDVIQPDVRLVGLWEEMIAEARTGQVGGTKSDRVRRLVRRDAEAVVQVLSLNDPAPNAIPPTRYVLITTDNALRRAYDRWFWEQNLDPEAYVLRHPSQYAPLLTSAAMRENSPVAQIARALDGLLDLPQHAEGAERTRVLSSMVHGSRAGVPGDDSTDAGGDEAQSGHGPRPSLDRVRRLWYDAGRNAVVLNASVVRVRMAAEFDEVAEFLREAPDVRMRLLDRLDRNLRALEVAHAKLVLDGMATGIVRTAVGPWPPGDELLVRKPFKAGEVVGPSDARDRPLVGAPGATPGASGSLHDPDDRIVLFFAACAAAWAGRWRMALRSCRRAIEMLAREVAREPDLGSDFNLLELHYLEAVAFRRSASDAGVYAEVRVRLSESERRFRLSNDGFGLARTLAEAAASRVSMAFLARGRVSGRAPPIMYDRDIVDAVGMVVEATRHASDQGSLCLFSAELGRTATRILLYEAVAGPHGPSLKWEEADGLRHVRSETAGRARRGADALEDELLDAWTRRDGDASQADELSDCAKRFETSDAVTRAVLDMATWRRPSAVDAP